jgi:adenine-specific DNA methylase
MYDSKHEIYGKTGVLTKYYKSPYAQKQHAKEAFRELLANLSPQKSIFISYNSEGILHKDDIIQMLRVKGKLILYKKPYRRYASTISKIEDQLYEYLFYVDCQIKDIQYNCEEILYI